MNSHEDEALPESTHMPDFTTVVDWHGKPDPSLQRIVELSHVAAPSLTLYMPWGIASGSVVSGREFFTNASELMRSGGANFRYEEMANQYHAQALIDPMAKLLFDSVADTYPETGDSYIETKEHQGHGTVAFIHLRNAKCWVGNRVISHEFLRVQLSHVTGWAYGAFSE
ncbi:hypothetical protein [Nocardia sp. NPDC059691]|uniref:hypothetical protein n=1 Tax=Nocardia sp. NPDC059691 TaxID=3346908 RepID=UPI0036BE8F63